MANILVVDDDVRNLFALTTVFERYSINVITAESGKEAIQILNENPKIEMVLMDIMMPEMDGYNVFSGLKDNPDSMDIPFIFITGSTEKKEVEMGLGIGADGYISKPFDEVELFEKIDQCLKVKK